MFSFFFANPYFLNNGGLEGPSILFLCPIVLFSMGNGSLSHARFNVVGRLRLLDVFGSSINHIIITILWV